MVDHILVPTAPGELIDKLTILRLKEERIADPEKVANIRFERQALMQIVTAHVPQSEALDALQEELYQVNAALWVIEDDIRVLERAKDFGDVFIQRARAVYITNDRRADVKKQINVLLGSALIEEKSYADYGIIP